MSVGAVTSDHRHFSVSRNPSRAATRAALFNADGFRSDLPGHLQNCGNPNCSVSRDGKPAHARQRRGHAREANSAGSARVDAADLIFARARETDIDPEASLRGAAACGAATS
jgi:hypothetical protein